jgi:type II secretory pathway pseudopilin PulG
VSRRRAPGMTLIEIMVYSVLLGLLMTGVYSAFYISKTYWDSAQGTTEVQQQCLRAMNGINRVLSQGNASSLAIFSYGSPPHQATTGFVVLSAKTPSGLFQHQPTTGEIMWQRWVAVYIDPNALTNGKKLRELRMREQIITPVPSPPANPTANSIINASVSANNPAYSVIARDLGSPDGAPNPVPGLVLTGGGGGGAGSLVGPYTVTTETVSTRFGINRISVNSTVWMHH